MTLLPTSLWRGRHIFLGRLTQLYSHIGNKTMCTVYLEKQMRNLVECPKETSQLQATVSPSFSTFLTHPQASGISISAHTWPKQSTLGLLSVGSPALDASPGQRRRHIFNLRIQCQILLPRSGSPNLYPPSVAYQTCHFIMFMSELGVLHF